ncbi:hypothetical protein GPZ77_14355 [Streptomyces sp. QHH-9511]|uniref:hypothetical protein n=1 Tax=Streptomyces sp. QHH-9511 TaxID=2684468 RepID=UPI0013188A9E|nr:hypothetical protein [Streptomyces sp. QHH-9511]QGZ49394.1 hypothetical protein GPZ77_14355 [Streptomyces sp. QHH-9511]GGU13440.1 hypothetical protein GCM10010272_68190 [Streptomyces lateritius]
MSVDPDDADIGVWFQLTGPDATSATGSVSRFLGRQRSAGKLNHAVKARKCPDSAEGRCARDGTAPLR